MTEPQAERLAALVRAGGFTSVVVHREGRFFLLAVETGAGQVLLRDDEDWRWLQKQ